MQHQSSNFEDILLPPVMVAALYSQCLVVADGITDPVKVTGRLISDDTGTYPILQPAQPEVAEMQPTYQPLEVSSKILHLGDFLKSILVLVNDENNVYLGEAELDLLGKMLQALRLSFADIAIINTAGKSLEWNQVSEQFPATHIMLFGVESNAVRIPVRLPHFRVQKWSNASFLYSPALTEINRVSPEQVAYKKELWRALQDLFKAV